MSFSTKWIVFRQYQRAAFRCSASSAHCLSLHSSGKFVSLEEATVTVCVSGRN